MHQYKTYATSIQFSAVCGLRSILEVVTSGEMEEPALDFGTQLDLPAPGRLRRQRSRVQVLVFTHFGINEFKLH